MWLIRQWHQRNLVQHAAESRAPARTGATTTAGSQRSLTAGSTLFTSPGRDGRWALAGSNAGLQHRLDVLAPGPGDLEAAAVVEVDLVVPIAADAGGARRSRASGTVVESNTKSPGELSLSARHGLEQQCQMEDHQTADGPVGARHAMVLRAGSAPGPLVPSSSLASAPPARAWHGIAVHEDRLAGRGALVAQAQQVLDVGPEILGMVAQPAREIARPRRPRARPIRSGGATGAGAAALQARPWRSASGMAAIRSLPPTDSKMPSHRRARAGQQADKVRGWPQVHHVRAHRPCPHS